MATTVQTPAINQNNLPSSTETSTHPQRINEEFMNSLFKESDADSVHAIVISLERSAKRLREIDGSKGMKGFSKLPVDAFEDKVLHGRETFSVPKPSGIAKQSKTKPKDAKKSSQDKYHNNILVKYSKDFFDRFSKNTTVAQKKDILHQLEKSWGFKSELRSNAHAADYVNYIRKLWIKYALDKLQKPPSQTSEPSTAANNHKITKQELETLFDVQNDCKDKKSVVDAMMRSVDFFHSKNFEHVLQSHVEQSAIEKMGEEFDLKPMKNVHKNELEKEHLDELMEVENVSQVAKSRRKNHKLFQERLLNKYSMAFFEGLKKLGADVARDVISDLALEWLFDKSHLKLHADDGMPVPTDDVINFLRHVWVKRIRGKLDMDHRELARLLSEREKEVAKFCKQSMENLHKTAVEHAVDNQGRPVVKKDEWESLENTIESKVRDVFEEIKRKVYPTGRR